MRPRHEHAVLALTVMAALEAVPYHVRWQAEELIRGGAEWPRVAQFVIDSTRREDVS